MSAEWRRLMLGNDSGKGPSEREQPAQFPLQRGAAAGQLDMMDHFTDELFCTESDVQDKPTVEPDEAQSTVRDEQEVKGADCDNEKIDEDAEQLHWRAMQADPVYKQWVPRLRKSVRPLADVAGPFTRRLKAASLFGACQSERKVLELMRVPVDWLFTCDKKPCTMCFSEDAFSRADHHFMDAMSFLENTDELIAERLYHRGPCSLKDVPPMLLDLLFVSTSCRPYSKARTGRAAGTSDHDDVRCIDVFFVVFKHVKPKACLFEQVFGFAMAESKYDKESLWPNFCTSWLLSTQSMWSPPSSRRARCIWCLCAIAFLW